MAHHLYTTAAFVLHSTPAGEANRFLDLFTRELGLVRCFGKSIREGRSKLRYGLQPLSFADVGLVRGRELWRLTGASPGLSIPGACGADTARLYLAARIARLLVRLVQGEEKNEDLFVLVEGGMKFLAEEKFQNGQLQNFECVLVLQILHRLGYLGGEDFGSFLSSPFSHETIAAIDPIRTKAIVTINRSLRETHL